MNFINSVRNRIQQIVTNWKGKAAYLSPLQKILIIITLVVIAGGTLWAGALLGRQRLAVSNSTPNLGSATTPPLKSSQSQQNTQPSSGNRNTQSTPHQQNTPPVHPTEPTTSSRTYTQHTRIIATTFWVGEVFKSNVSDGSQVCSTYDQSWALHWSGGINNGQSPAGTACEGAPYGGCDGVSSNGGRSCETEVRTAANGYFPTHTTPAENPFYLDVPFDDLNDPVVFASRCHVIPWANDPGYSGHCTDHAFSYMKNRWVKLIGPNGATCYGQVEDAGPSHDSLYHDSAYVFGSDNRQPIQGQFNNAGADVSPALNGCLGFQELNGENDRINWQFVDDAAVPAGPWRKIVTTSGVTQ